MVEKLSKKDSTVKTFRVFTNSRRVFELNCDSHPIAVKPQWTVTHARDGHPVGHGIADLDLATDGMSARLITHDWAGSVKVTVTFGIHPRTTVTESFQVEIEPITHVSSPLKLAFSQHRDRPI
jgi:hypothetical protein